MQNTRRATHAGSWYSSDPRELSTQIARWLEEAEVGGDVGRLQAVISPHAGYSYCGRTAASAWKQLQPDEIDTVVLLGPSHHKHLRRCALPSETVATYATPLGNIPLHRQGIEKLRETGQFETLPLDADELEHSIEMQLPFLKFVMGDKQFSIIPILIGDLQAQSIKMCSSLLQSLFESPRTIFIVSSDFCHWGRRFHYLYIPPTPYYIAAFKNSISINSSIEQLDMEGIAHIQKQDLQAFGYYIKTTGNTICGEKPIQILLSLIGQSHFRHQTRLLQYSQSGPVESTSGNSVSYASLETRCCC